MKNNFESSEDIIYDPNYMSYLQAQEGYLIKLSKLRSLRKTKGLVSKIFLASLAVTAASLFIDALPIALTFLGAGICVSNLALSVHFRKLIRQTDDSATDLSFKIIEMKHNLKNQQLQKQKTNKQIFDSAKPSYDFGEYNFGDKQQKPDDTIAESDDPGMSYFVDQEIPSEETVYMEVPKGRQDTSSSSSGIRRGRTLSKKRSVHFRK